MNVVFPSLLSQMNGVGPIHNMFISNEFCIPSLFISSEIFIPTLLISNEYYIPTVYLK